jgi:DNA-binding MarR family transcriptional regulator
MVLKRAEQALLRAKSDALKPIGLTLPQYVALSELDAQPGITAAALARACLVTPQAMMVALKAMHEQDLVSRSAHPRHATVLEIRLTDVGREALDAARTALRPIEQRVNDALSSDELNTLRELLLRVTEATESPE